MPWRNLSNQPLSDMQAEWYQRLKDEGFDDIEDTSHPDRPLLSWHSTRFISARIQEKMFKRLDYQREIDAFASDPQFQEILHLLVKHGNSKFNKLQVEEIWNLHRHGSTEREIADEMRVSKSCIHFLLVRIKEWMKLIA